MGADIVVRKKKNVRKSPKTKNPYITLLLYRFLARRAGSEFNKIVLKRLCMSSVNKPPVSLSSVARLASKEANQGKVIVIVGTVLDDDRCHDLPKLKVSDKARSKIYAAGGVVMTFDQLAAEHPDGKKTLLMQGKRNARKAVKCFGPAPGSKHSTTRPRVRHKGRKVERSRGRK